MLASSQCLPSCVLPATPAAASVHTASLRVRRRWPPRRCRPSPVNHVEARVVVAASRHRDEPSHPTIVTLLFCCSAYASVRSAWRMGGQFGGSPRRQLRAQLPPGVAPSWCRRVHRATEFITVANVPAHDICHPCSQSNPRVLCQDPSRCAPRTPMSGQIALAFGIVFSDVARPRAKSS